MLKKHQGWHLCITAIKPAKIRMKIGIVGIGKLGLPIAIAINAKGHDVRCYDKHSEVNSNSKIQNLIYTHEKAENLIDNLDDMIKKSTVQISDTLLECIQSSDIIFVAVQTPHNHLYGGQTPIPIRI